MADVKCAICGEYWDYWGARHGDMKWWEFDLFRKGAGCPCCEGQKPEGEDHMIDHLRSVVFGGVDEPDIFERLHDVPELGGEPAPVWEEPDPKVLWKCHGCGVSAVISNEAPYDGKEISSDDVWLEWSGGKRLHYSCGGGPYQYGSVATNDPDREPPYELDGESYCPDCASCCAGCGKTLLTAGHFGFCDTYDAGNPFPNPHDPFRGSMCLDCYEEANNELREELDE